MSDDKKVTDTKTTDVAATTTEAKAEDTTATTTPKDEAVTKARAAYWLPSTWTDAQVKDWYNTADHNELRTDRGNWIYDPTRNSRPVVQWEFGEIEDWVEGRLALTTNDENVQASIIARYVDRLQLSKEWTDSQVLAYVRTGEKPATTQDGILLVSKERATRKAENWTEAELVAWVNGQIASTDKATDACLAHEVKRRFDLPEAASTVEEIKAAQKQGLRRAVYTSTPNGLTPEIASAIQDELNYYYEAVCPGKWVNETSGLQAQNRLDSLFSYVGRLEGIQFVAGMDMIRDFVQQYRYTLFSDDYAFRFVHLLPRNTRKHNALVTAFQIITSTTPNFIRQQDLLFSFDDPKAEMYRDYFLSRAR